MNWSHRSLGTVAVALLVVLAGCSSVVSDGGDAEAIAEQVQQRHDQIEDLHGVQTITYAGASMDGEITVEVWQQPPDKMRQEVRSDTQSGTEGDVIVQNGETTWFYDADRNEVTRMNISTDLSGNTMVDADAIDRMLDRFDVSLAGTDTVAGRETQVLDLDGTDEDGMVAYDRATIWVDSEYWYPLKYEIEMAVGNESTTVTMAFEEVEFNAGVPAERFEFEPPEDAEVSTRTGPQIESVDDLAAADEATDFDVGEPAVPERFSLSGVQIMESDGNATVVATYESDDGRLTYTAGVGGFTPRGDTVQVGDTEGTSSSAGDFASVQVVCDDIVYGMTSQAADEDELVDALAALECT